MKKIIKFLAIILCLTSITACRNKTNDINYFNIEFNTNNTISYQQEYFGVEEDCTIELNSNEDFLAFIKLINDADKENLQSDDYQQFDINFKNQKVVVTPTYLNDSSAKIKVNSLVENDDKLIATMDVKISNIAQFGVHKTHFLFIILDKEYNKKVEVKRIPLKTDGGISVVYKPIIYFYPTEKIDLEVKYVNEENLITTYPKYETSWKLSINEDGTFTTTASNREYYALYFDEKLNYNCTFKEGFYVTKDSAISFLESKLDYIGLTNKEANEFIMYWLPILEANEQSIVYFEQTEERNKECPLEFSISPDSVSRTIIHIKKVECNPNIKEQTLIHEERIGFSVVEWGGCTY